MAGDGGTSPAGLLLQWTPTIHDFLVGVKIHTIEKHQPVPYALLRDAWSAASPSMRPCWRRLLSGSSIIFKSPEPRQKSEELKARLAHLQEIAERKAYQELVKDVSPYQQDQVEYFSSYKEQLGFGIHVIVIMFTGYLVGHALFRALLGGSPALHAAGGISGMVIGMLVETMLFIIRASNADGSKTKVKKRSFQTKTRSKMD